MATLASVYGKESLVTKRWVVAWFSLHNPLFFPQQIGSWRWSTENTVSVTFPWHSFSAAWSFCSSSSPQLIIYSWLLVTEVPALSPQGEGYANDWHPWASRELCSGFQNPSSKNSILQRSSFFSKVRSYFQSCHGVYWTMFIFRLLFQTILLPENKEQILALRMHILHQKEKQSPAWPLWKVCLLSGGWVSMGMRGWRQNAACSVCHITPPGESGQHLIVRCISISA